MTTTVKRNSNPTLTDLMDILDPKGQIADVVEALNETNEMLSDITFVECNNKFSHQTTVRSGLPKATWRKLNYGVQPSKSETRKVTDACGMLEAMAKVDKKLAEMNGMKESWRASEDSSFLESMNQEVQRALLFGDSSVEPEKFMGLAPRFNTTNVKKAKNAVNVIDAGGTGDNLTSIWLVGWSPKTVHCIYPENSQIGLKKEDLGEGIATDENGGEYVVLRTHFGWDLGLTVRDWRYVVRIANISRDMLKADPTETGALNLYDKLIDAEAQIPSLQGARFAFYCNRTVETYLRKQQANSKNVQLSLNEVGGHKVLGFDGIPFRRVDALEFTESQVK